MAEPNPVLVEVTRTPLIESRHRGAAVVCRPDGERLVEIGDIGASVFPRSAIKGLQSIALVESGAADALGLSEAEIALTCSSHNGETRHVEAARSMLAKAGLDESALECGVQWPRREADRGRLHLAGEIPGPVHNNCSGKHSGFLCLSRHMDVETAGYIEPGHPVQTTIRDVVSGLTGAELTADICGRDGCSIPTYAVPLDSLATAFARFVTGSGMNEGAYSAARRIYRACVENPFMVAGTEKFSSRAMEMLEGLIFVKNGAEGVFCGAVPSVGVGIAIKCDDGNSRAAEVMMAAVIGTLLPSEIDTRPGFRELATPALKNWRGFTVGEIRPSSVMIESLRPLAGR